MLLNSFRFFIILFLTSSSLLCQNKDASLHDSIKSYLKEADNIANSIEIRFHNARKAISLSKKTREDSIILKSNRVLSYLFIVNENYDSLYRINHINLKLSTRLKDTLKMGYATHNIAFYFDDNLILDSAYYYYVKAKKHYNSAKKPKSEASVLLNLANIQETERDFIGSEINAIRAVNILKELPESDSANNTLWSLYNLVAIVSDQIELYDKSIEYHNKAISLSNKIKDNYILNLFSRTNIGILYRKKGEYEKAISIFNEIKQTPDIKVKSPSTYASILSSIAYTRLLNKDQNSRELASLFRESLNILKKEEDVEEIMTTSEYLSEYFLREKETDSALYYADEAYKIADRINSNQTKLNVLLLKSKIEVGENSKRFLYKHIKLSDSLILNERLIRNKFARIELETDEIKAENKQISKQKFWLMVFSGVLIVTLFLLYIIITQRAKNKELQFIHQQQETNEEIYNLMLSQQDKIDEGRSEEKRRISEELHDGILGRLFGTRLSLDSLNFNTNEEAIKTRSNYINELKAIEQDIRKVSHDLNTDFVAGSGYIDIIKTLVETQTKAYSLNYDLKHSDDINWDETSNKTKIHIYRIIQESLQNIYKHANAKTVKISFQLKNNVILLSITDDGSGFDINKAKKGIGLKNITSRTKEIQGELDITSNKGIGTSISIKVPV